MTVALRHWRRVEKPGLINESKGAVGSRWRELTERGIAIYENVLLLSDRAE
jgi:hypothetical protein